MLALFRNRDAIKATHDLTVLDPRLEALLGKLRSYGAPVEAGSANLRTRYGLPYEPPYWRFFFEEPVESVQDAPKNARRLVVSAKARDFARIGELTQLEAVSVSDFGPNVPLLLATLPKLTCLALWSGPLTDLRGFGSLTRLEHLLVCGANRLQTLEGLDDLQRLETLRLAGVPKLTRLDPIGALRRLRGLELHAGTVSGTIADRTKFESLRPLRHLTNLEMLRMWAIRTEDDDLSPVASLSALKELEVPPRTFPIEAMAMAAAAHPRLREQWSKPLGAVVPCRECGEKKARVIGRGSRDICAHCHSEKLERFFQRFQQRVDALAAERSRPD